MHKYMGKNGSPKHSQPLVKNLLLSDLLMIFIVAVKNICKLRGQLTTKHKNYYLLNLKF